MLVREIECPDQRCRDDVEKTSWMAKGGRTLWLCARLADAGCGSAEEWMTMVSPTRRSDNGKLLGG